jgi:hypothetical protein
MPRRRLEPLLLPATCLLLLTVAGRAVVTRLAPEPVRASEVLGVDPARFPHGRLVLLADSADLPGLADAAVAARRPDSGLPLERRVLAPAGGAHRRLVRAYGFQLPILLTVDAEARVVRIEPL